MAFRPLLRPRAGVPIAATILTSGTVLSTSRPVFAESPDAPSRKPIYDEPSATAEPSDDNDSTPTGTRKPKGPTPTDRLATEIGKTRLYLHGHVVRVEDRVNNWLTRALRLEHSFTSTIAGLAPPKESNEKVVPGLLYVLVASMAGSILTRNRNILLRATMPGLVGLGCAYAVMPLTMRNVGDLAWYYEEKFPVVAENHIRVKERVEQVWETSKSHSAMTVAMVEDKVSGVRKAVEDWVKKGK